MRERNRLQKILVTLEGIETDRWSHGDRGQSEAEKSRRSRCTIACIEATSWPAPSRQQGSGYAWKSIHQTYLLPGGNQQQQATESREGMRYAVVRNNFAVPWFFFRVVIILGKGLLKRRDSSIKALSACFQPTRMVEFPTIEIQIHRLLARYDSLCHLLRPRF